MNGGYVCWRCGADLVELILPMSRREECPTCAADQHVCKMCKSYAPNLSDGCSEERAEEVNDKERANFCDYFSPMTNVYTAKDSSNNAAQAQLDDLFGDGEAPSAGEDQAAAAKARAELDKLFSKD
ncbi:MAG: hypothetical protein ACR2PS_18845 [Pseudomonadales bacterium]